MANKGANEAAALHCSLSGVANVSVRCMSQFMLTTSLRLSSFPYTNVYVNICIHTCSFQSFVLVQSPVPPLLLLSFLSLFLFASPLFGFTLAPPHLPLCLFLFASPDGDDGHIGRCTSRLIVCICEYSDAHESLVIWARLSTDHYTVI